MVFDLVPLDAVGDFGVEAIAWADYGDFGVGIEEVEDAACSYLGCVNVNVSGAFCRPCDKGSLPRRRRRPGPSCCALARPVLVIPRLAPLGKFRPSCLS